MDKTVSPELTDEQRHAQALWAVGMHGPQIARLVGVRPQDVWRWRSELRWPKRVARDPSGPQRAMAAKLWREDVPRATVAALAGIAVSTLDVWRKRFKWKRRKPGLKAGCAPQRADTIRQQTVGVSTKAMQAAIEKVRAERAGKVQWRCDCGTRRNDLNCLICQRTHPLAVSAT